jgi:hypothetical protein
MEYFSGLNTGVAAGEVTIKNWNPDVDDDGDRDDGPFWDSVLDGVPQVGTNVVRLERAKRIDYLGAGSTTNIPSGGLAIATRDVFVDTGAVFTGNDGLLIAAGRHVGFREGYTLVNQSLGNHGTLAPGLQLGSVAIGGNYLQYFDGTLDIQLRGTTPDTGHDRLVVAGFAYLAGVLNISLLGGFVPATGDSFTVLATGHGIVGDFHGIALPMLSPGNVWDISRTLTGYTLTVMHADFNLDGIVDAADYTLWRKNVGVSVTPGTYQKADGNGDGIVDNDDLMLWRQNFGNVRGTSPGAGAGSLAGAPIPEPSTMGLLALAAGTILAANRRVCRAVRP